MEPRDVAPRPHAASFPPSSPGAAHACSTGVRDASDACALESFVGTVFRSFPVAFFQVRGWLLFSARVGCFSAPGLVAFQCQDRCAGRGAVVAGRATLVAVPFTGGQRFARRGTPVSLKSFRPARPHALTPARSHARTFARSHVRTFSRRRQSCITARPCSCTTSCRSSCGGTWRRFRRVVGKRIRCGGRRSRRWVRCL